MREKIQLTFDTPEDTPLSILSRTLEDLDTYLELVLTLANPRLDDVPIPRQWRSRRKSRLDESEQVLVAHISRSSPLVINLDFGASVAIVGMAWTVIQAIDLLVLLPGKQKLQGLEIEEKKLDIELKKQQLSPTDHLVPVAHRELDESRERETDPGDPAAIQRARQTEELESLVVARGAENAWRQSLVRLAQDLPVTDVQRMPSEE
jgi:hypothetical protein